jgi:hypothetical protein
MGVNIFCSFELIVSKGSFSGQFLPQVAPERKGFEKNEGNKSEGISGMSYRNDR